MEEQAEWADWYRTTVGKEPNYSTLLEEIASSPEERRSILHHYIEPTQVDRDEGRKIPTAAHHAIAELVRGGYIRVIITTNFDRLMENALREKGIEPTIVSSVDALAGAEPIVHSDCFILKLHGDYKDARILNTTAELSAYSQAYGNLLDRIFDEHGLIVAGWSGEWDHALRAAILRAPNRRYSFYWTTRGQLGAGAQDLVDHRRAKMVQIADANSFFQTLSQRVETLEKSQQQNPVGINMVISSAKRFLAKSEYRIQLDDLFTQETQKLLARLDLPEFMPNGKFDKVVFRERIQLYESAVEPVACMAGVLGRWGDDREFNLIADILKSLFVQSEKIRSGLNVLLGLRTYPAVLVFTAYALGLVRAERWSTLHRLFIAMIFREDREPKRTVDTLFLWSWQGGNKEYWQLLEGLENHKTPLSDHLLKVFSEWSKHFGGQVPEFELLYEKFEILGSLASLEQHTAIEVVKELENPQSYGMWMPLGRSGWNSRNADIIFKEFQTKDMEFALAQSGFGRGELTYMEPFINNFHRLARRMRY